MVHIDHNDLVFLLGAGASKNADLPLANDMTERFIEVVKCDSDEEHKRLLSLILGGIHFLRGSQGLFPQPTINIEDVASTIDALRNRHVNQLSPFVGSWNDQIRLFDSGNPGKRDCLSGLHDLLQAKLKDWLAIPPLGKIRYFESLRDIAKVCSKCINLFTLNYDLCVETALQNADIPFTTGFDEHGWKTVLFDQECVRVYKLHGSLAWYRDDEDGSIYSTLTPPKDRIPAADYSPLLVFGTANKLQAIDPFLHLSYTFSERVKAAKVVAAIGYGFADDYINQMLRQGLDRDSRKRLIVIGRDKDDARQTLMSKFHGAPELVDAERVSFIDGDTGVALTQNLLLDEIQHAFKDATEEGPF